MKRALLVSMILLIGMGAFAMGREESFGRNTDPAYDYVYDNSVSPTGLWENVFETDFDVPSQKFIPHIASRTCKGLVVYIDYMPIRRIEWAVAKNETMQSYFEVYVISDYVVPFSADATAGDSAAAPAPAGAAAPVATAPTTAAPVLGPGEFLTSAGEIVKLLGAADVGNVVKYRLVGRNVVFDFINLPATAKMITVKIQTADANRYVETRFKAAGNAAPTR